jgi:hypothetical protein
MERPSRGGEDSKEERKAHREAKIKYESGKSRGQPRPGAGPWGVAQGGDGWKTAHRFWSKEPGLACSVVGKLSPQDTTEGELAQGRGPDGQGLPSRAIPWLK